ncbi:hypothetical protein ACTD5D_09280 [Nocardia takedensis]|uniref:hypothetical protein n=1 Tax=Nocardia takedensis TaxID=259390 RepID=UPI0002DE2E42|nr:hypothetical protein [Nocardia takedensis]
MITRLLRGLVVLIALVGAAVVPMPRDGVAHAEPVFDCGWSRRIGADTVNVALPDTFANYWMTAVPALPAEGLTLRGTFPHGRYLSFTSYRGSQTLDGLNDLAIEPDAGSVNPFRPGAERTATDRAYTVRVKPGPRPERPEPNTLYADAGLAVVLYRVYRPDAGLDPLGGAGLPEFTVEGPGGPRTLPPCQTSDQVVDPNGIHAGSGISLPAALRGADYRTWARTSGNGVFANPDNTYLASRVAPAAGQVAVVRATLPGTPATVAGQPRMTVSDLRYWSLCANEVFSTRVAACVVDDEIPVDAKGEFTVVVSDPADRPANARLDCGVAWLPTTRAATLLLMRNMLPAPDFAEAIQFAPQDDPAAGMGAYYPRTDLVAAAEFAANGCAAR